MTPVFVAASLSLISLSQGLSQVLQCWCFGPGDSLSPRLPCASQGGSALQVDFWVVCVHSCERQGEEAEGGGGLEWRQAEHPRVWLRAPRRCRRGSPIHLQLLLTLTFQSCSALLGLCALETVQASSCLRQHFRFDCRDTFLSDGEGRPITVSITCTFEAWGSPWVLTCSKHLQHLHRQLVLEEHWNSMPKTPSEDMKICCAGNFVFFFIHTCSCVWLRLCLSWKINTWILNNNNYCFWLFWIYWQRPLQNNCTDQSHGGAEEDPWVGVWWEH